MNIFKKIYNKFKFAKDSFYLIKSHCGYEHYKPCLDKLNCFKNQESAYKAIKRPKNEYLKGYYSKCKTMPYKCPNCTYWHITRV